MEDKRASVMDGFRLGIGITLWLLLLTFSLGVIGLLVDVQHLLDRSTYYEQPEQLRRR